MPSRHNGGVIGKANTPTLSVASGIWNMNAVHRARLSNTFPYPPAPGITFGAKSGTNTYAGSTSAKTVSLALGGESNRILIACISQSWQATPSAVTFNGSNMTLADSETGGTRYASIYYMLEASLPGAGTYNLSVDPDVATRGGICCLYIYGAKQQAPEVATSFTNTVSSPISNSITTLTNNAFVVDVLNILSVSGLTVSGGQTEQFDFIDDTTCTAVSTKVATTAGSNSMGWSWTGGSERYNHVVTAWEVA